MKIKSPTSRHFRKGIPDPAEGAGRGFALSETLLVVALVAVVSSVSLRSLATQRKATMELERKADSNEHRDSMTWSATELPDGSKLWTREF
jgi:type II secretory pathway pseudopilin PulG